MFKLPFFEDQLPYILPARIVQAGLPDYVQAGKKYYYQVKYYHGTYKNTAV